MRCKATCGAAAEAIETARRMGYYEHPRDASLETVAAEHDLPLTTLRYAEAWAKATALEGYGFDSSIGSELGWTEEPTTPAIPVEED